MNEPVNTISVADLASILGDRDDRLRGLIKAGQIREVRRGRVLLTEAVPVFFDDLRAALRDGSASASAERAREAKADAAVLALAVRRRELVHRDEVDVAIEHLCGTINSALTSLPARVTRDPYTRRRMDELAFKTRDAIGRATALLAQEAEDD